MLNIAIYKLILVAIWIKFPVYQDFKYINLTIEYETISYTSMKNPLFCGKKYVKGGFGEIVVNKTRSMLLLKQTAKFEKSSEDTCLPELKKQQYGELGKTSKIFLDSLCFCYSNSYIQSVASKPFFYC